MIDKQAVGQRIKNIREQRGLTQEQLAENVNVSRSTIAGAENGKLTFDTLCMLADYLDTSTDYLLGRAEAANKAAEIINNLKRYFNIRFEKNSMYVSISDNLMKILKSLDEIEKIQSNSDFISKDIIESMKKVLFDKYSGILINDSKEITYKADFYGTSFSEPLNKE